MNTPAHTIVHPVSDLAAAKAMYSALLGVQPYVDEAYYVGYRVGPLELGLDPHGHASGMTGPVSFWHVDDIEARVETLLAAGAQEQQPVKDVGGGMLTAVVRDADGNRVGLRQSPAS
jgi:predicted enzyme related to lactoylglutathione lyase